MALDDDFVLTFTIDVEVTDPHRSKGPTGFISQVHRVRVEAHTDDEAIRVASQMVAGRLLRDSMVIATKIISVVA